MQFIMLQKDINSRTNESLCQYYLRTHNNLIPNGVEFRELDEETGQFIRYKHDPNDATNISKEKVNSNYENH